MKPTILLYGATGYSGRLIARELVRTDAEGERPCELILAGRDEGELARQAQELGVPYRVFGLDDRRQARAALGDADVVLNAAGPFANTAERIAKVALEVGCHYADIGGEPDVYLRLKELEPYASARGCVLAPSVGFWAAASNLLLALALPEVTGAAPFGAVRIAMSRIDAYSRGSAETVWRSLRQQVVVARRTHDVGGRPHMGVWHEPVGKLERRFDFRDPGARTADVRVASAVSLVDTLAALQWLRECDVLADRIESYVEMDDAARMLYQLGAWLTPVAAVPWLRTLAQQPLELLARGPTAAERDAAPHMIVLEIEDAFGDAILRWRWKTLNVYDFTAQLSAAIALRLGGPADLHPGWATAADVMKGAALDFGDGAPVLEGPLRGSELEKSLTLAVA